MLDVRNGLEQTMIDDAINEVLKCIRVCIQDIVAFAHICQLLVSSFCQR